MKKIFIALFILLNVSTNAQTDSTHHPLSISGYIETYYGYDFGNPANHSRPGFVYSHNRHNEINLNLGFVKMGYATEKVRANFALMTGSYANANLAAEPEVLKNIFEANAGVKISSKKNVWIDAGIFASHIGFESAIGRDCWTLTRSMLADNSPYYESGVKFSYTSDNGEWFVSGLFLNGWQRIQRVEANNTPAVGHQLTWRPGSKITLNSSSFVGSDTPDSIRQMRYFHNFYAQLQLHDKLGLIVGFDYGAQQKSKASRNYNTWYSPVIIAKYFVSDKFNLAVRGEYYNDENGVIINTETINGFQTYGYSLNFDYVVTENTMWRIEGKGFTSKDKIFTLDNKPDNSNYTITSSLAISF
ncbi:MAG: porin [Bacteroidetes bacterium]|jgi:hypothetical protein|nr:porin [Bacteroidota bacterium]